MLLIIKHSQEVVLGSYSTKIKKQVRYDACCIITTMGVSNIIITLPRL